MNLTQMSSNGQWPMSKLSFCRYCLSQTTIDRTLGTFLEATNRIWFFSALIDHFSFMMSNFDEKKAFEWPKNKRNSNEIHISRVSVWHRRPNVAQSDSCYLIVLTFDKIHHEIPKSYCAVTMSQILFTKMQRKKIHFSNFIFLFSVFVLQWTTIDISISIIFIWCEK